MHLQKIVSGGQTGVDRAALDVALDRGMPVGGWCPNGRRAEDGAIPERYPLTETPSTQYAQRTAWNVRDSDGTLLLTRGPLEGGTRLTKEEAEKRGKPWLHLRTDVPAPVETIKTWMGENGIRVLNVAGPRASEEEGIYEEARALLDILLERLSLEESE